MRTRSGQYGQQSSSDGFIMVDEMPGLPLRPRSNVGQEKTSIQLHPLAKEDAFIVCVRPPLAPATLERAPCEIVLVIDVSSSMTAAAPLPMVQDIDERESTGLSILDLTKHAARTELERLDEKDRLGIVAFSRDAKVAQKLMPMTPAGKRATSKRIDLLRTDSHTNLWAGTCRGLELFGQADAIGNLQGLFILTDGMPNHMCPPQGYAAAPGPRLSAMAKDGASIPTIRVWIWLQDPVTLDAVDCRVFVHAVANSFATMGTSATLELNTFKRATLNATAALASTWDARRKTLKLEPGNIQYGQTRDVVIGCPGIAREASIHAYLNYKLPNGQSQAAGSQESFEKKTALDRATVDYHKSRAAICGFLSSLFPLQPNGEGGVIRGINEMAQAHSRLNSIIASIQSLSTKNDPRVKSLLQDLKGDEPAGQVTKALILMSEKKENYWEKWGRHYLPSLLHAHQRQMCNSFKDPGPLMYGKESPLFLSYRDKLDLTFDTLPQPTPSLPERQLPIYSEDGSSTGTRSERHRSVTMSEYRSSEAPCFGGMSRISLADGSALPMVTLQAGMSVWTPTGARKVIAVVKTRISSKAGQTLCRIGELLVTPYHPLLQNGSWVFPKDGAETTEFCRSSVFSVLLAPSRDPADHAIKIGGQVCVTLGHGVVAGPEDDVRAHAFFGNHRRVALSLLQLPKGGSGHFRCSGVKRDPVSGLVCGFKA
ncbi:hypothetical protein KCU88_g2851, partial [Aureobasidium melanogenum]